jgi:hypothetical protein
MYTEFPTEFAAEYETISLVCLLLLALYSLKQSANVWSQTLSQSLKKISFMQNSIDNCLFEQKSHARSTYILVHVDDILFTDESLENARTDFLKIFFMINLEEA